MKCKKYIQNHLKNIREEIKKMILILDFFFKEKIQREKKKK